MTTKPDLYDSNDYYDGDGQASRLAPGLNSLLYFLDWFKAWNFIRVSGLLSKAKSTKRHLLRVIDIGAGDGKFLFFVKKFGFSPQGTTASSISQQAAKSKYEISLNLSKDIPEDFQKNKIDAITYWHVFEHLEQPESHVKVWSEILADDGIVMIEVPNIDGLGSRLCYPTWLGSDDKHHINHMSSAAIDEMLGRHGLTAYRREGFSLKFTYVYLWSAFLGRLFGVKEYSFDSVFGVLKKPGASIKKSPVMAINSILSVAYLSPLIILVGVMGLLTGQGEIIRLYARRVPSA